MPFTYSHNPIEIPRDAVRLVIGDTDPTDFFLHDGEIDYFLAEYETPLACAVRCAEIIMAKFARLADQSVGSVSVSYRQRFENYKTLRDELRNRQTIEDCLPYAGGISKADKKSYRDDTDRVKPQFRKDLMENENIAPWTSQSVINDEQSE